MMAANGKTTTLVLPPPTCAPALLNANAAEKKLYWDRTHYDSPDAQTRALARSSTVYVGNLSFTTRSTHLHNHFQHLGPVVQVHIGLDRHKKTPCGFAFVEFRHRIDALSAVVNLTGTKLDGRVIRVELDAGFKPGREYGRGASGGQVRDDRGGGSGRDRRNNNNNSSSVGGGGNERPRWEPPSAPKADDVGHYGRGGGGEGRDISDSRAGEKRGREDATMEQEQEDDENNSGNNQKMYHYDDDENL